MNFRGTLAAVLMTGGLLSAQEESPVALQSTAAPTKGRPTLRVAGKAQLPEGTVVRIALQRLEESERMGRLVSTPVDSPLTMFHQVRGKKISAIDFPGVGPGLYRAVVELPEGSSAPAAPPRKWEFTLPAWDEALIGQLEPGLVQVDERMEEALKLLDRFREGCLSKEVWEASSKELVREAQEFVRKLDQTEARKLYPASIGVIRFTMQSLTGHAAAFKFGEDGKFAGAHHRHLGEIKTLHQEEFTFDNLRKDVAEAGALAGREFSLWVIREFHRGGALKDALKEHSKHPGISSFADRLAKMFSGDEDPDALEKEIRGVEEKGNR